MKKTGLLCELKDIELKTHHNISYETTKIAYGDQEGAEEGYNTVKKGGKCYHPLLAFRAGT